MCLLASKGGHSSKRNSYILDRPRKILTLELYLVMQYSKQNHKRKCSTYGNTTLFSFSSVPPPSLSLLSSLPAFPSNVSFLPAFSSSLYLPLILPQPLLSFCFLPFHFPPPPSLSPCFTLQSLTWFSPSCLCTCVSLVSFPILHSLFLSLIPLLHRYLAWLLSLAVAVGCQRVEWRPLPSPSQLVPSFWYSLSLSPPTERVDACGSLR